VSQLQRLLGMVPAAGRQGKPWLQTELASRVGKPGPNRVGRPDGQRRRLDLPERLLQMNVQDGPTAGCVTGPPVARKKTSALIGNEPAASAALPAPAADAAAGPPGLPPFGLHEAAALLEAGRLDVAAGLALAALDRRAGTGDAEAAAAAAVLRAQQAALAGLPPLHGAPRRLPHVNERGAAAFTELLALLRLQEGQLVELHAALAELT